MAQITTPQRSVGRISVCPIPLLPGSGYLLVDPGAFSDNGELDFLRPLTCTPTNWGRDFTGLPAIVDLAQCDLEQRDWLVSVINNEHENRLRVPLMHPGICAYIEAPVDARALASHLADQMLVMPVERGGYRARAAALWRFFDPRVFANLCWILSPSHLSVLVGPVSRWVFPWLGNWYEFTAFEEPQSDTDLDRGETQHERVAGFARIDLDVWDRAQRIAMINQTLVRLRMPDELAWQERVVLAARVESALTEAECRLHWKQPEDQLNYAEHFARYGAAFRNHPRLVDRWSLLEMKTEAFSFSELVALLTTEEREELVLHARNPDSGAA